ncbi:retrotransposon protein, putative, ty1-copia subclass [Tanacetum coccineum]
MDGAVHTYKARLVAKGFTQTLRIDYEETFSPVAYIRAIRILIAIDAFYDYEIWQMDVKTVFLNGYLNKKQASRQWNKRFDDEIKKFGFSQNRDEPCVYVKVSRSYVTFLILYVDDILIMGNNIPMLQDVKSYLGRCFAMKDLGEAAYILGIKIYRDRSKRLISLYQIAYIEKIMKRFYMENSKRRTILDEVIKSSVEDFVPISSESEDTSGSNNDCDLPLSDDFSPISIFEEKSVTFSNPLFDLNDFTSSDNESLSDEDVSEDNVKIYSNPLFEFDDEYISSDVNPLFDEVLEDIECKDSFESTFLVTPLFDSNKDECFTPSDDVELLLHHDPSISVVSILEGFTDEPPLEENDNLFDLESKMNDWKKILYAAPIDDLITEDKVFDPRIHEIIFSPTNGSLPFEDHH